MHLSPKLLRMFLRGEVSSEVLAQAALRHLLEVCDDCREQWHQGGESTFGSEQLRPPAHNTDLGFRSSSIEELKDQEDRIRRLRKERRKARADLRSLLAVPAAERRAKIENARTRFRSMAFVDLLLEESKQQIRHDSELAEQLADLVPLAIHWMSGKADPAWAFRVKANAIATKANALRISGDLQGAEQCLRDLRHRLARSPILKSKELGEIYNIEASLRFAQRRYEDAEVALDRAILHYRSCDHDKGLAQALILRGNLAFHDSRFEEALAAYSQARPVLDVDQEPFLVQGTISGQLHTLCELQRFNEAEELLKEYLYLYEDKDTYTSALLAGLEGRIALGMGDPATAEDRYVACRDGYLATGRNHDATLACLDIARAMLQQGKTAEVTEMATEVLEIFRARGAEQEALSALILIQEAAASRTLTTAILRQARKLLESHSA